MNKLKRRKNETEFHCTREKCNKLNVAPPKKRSSDTCYNVDDIEDIMLSEISQSQKTNIVWFHLSEVPRVVKFVEKWEQRLPGVKKGKMRNVV